MPWSDDNSMLYQANGLMYGLAAAIGTNNPKMAMHAAEDIKAGYVWINAQGRYLGAPYAAGNKAESVKRRALISDLATRESKILICVGDFFATYQCLIFSYSGTMTPSEK